MLRGGLPVTFCKQLCTYYVILLNATCKILCTYFVLLLNAEYAVHPTCIDVEAHFDLLHKSTSTKSVSVLVSYLYICMEKPLN